MAAAGKSSAALTPTHQNPFPPIDTPPTKEQADQFASPPLVHTRPASPLSFFSSVKDLTRHSNGSINCLHKLLLRAADSNAGITVYPPLLVVSPIRLTYRDLLTTATERAKSIIPLYDVSAAAQSDDDTPGSNPPIILLHFDTHLESIVWFWAATLAGFLPAISTPLSNDPVQRRRHLTHLKVVLNDPIVLTSQRLKIDFPAECELRVRSIESIPPVETLSTSYAPLQSTLDGNGRRGDDLAVLMLTSGSTGNAKAVGLRHQQILTAINGKSAHHGIEKGEPFLNWIAMDHVANLTEVHLQAMNLCSEQVHVQPADVLSDPLHSLRLLDRHKIVYTFAPNFFLARLNDTLANNPNLPQLDLSRLRAFISGGESNVVDTCASLTQRLCRHGVKGDVIRPGFGMTETCAGSIYSKTCPSYDRERRLEFACLGYCVPGIKMRVVNDYGVEVPPGEVGNLQVTGPIVFKEYFNNPAASKDALSSDGWFKSGDRAYLDPNRNLNLVGRTKDTIIINGVKFSSTEVETAIEEEGIIGVAPSFTVVFPFRPEGSHTEQTGVVFSSKFAHDDKKSRFESTEAIRRVVGLTTGSDPAEVFPLPKAYLEKTSLGKISRTKVRSAFEEGHFQHFQTENATAVTKYRESIFKAPETSTEKSLATIFGSLLDLLPSSISVDTSIFELGVTSFSLLSVKQQIQSTLSPSHDIPLSALLLDPTIHGIANAINLELSKPRVYDPVVPLQPHGSKTPLWCIHPGSGDILVFIQLARQFTDRPVYALRTRGYNPGEPFFSSLAEAADTYVSNILKHQFSGPYAIAGYSLGSTLAYEVGKRLRVQGHEVRFLASIDYPPFIKQFVQDLNWTDVLLHIAFFLDLLTSEQQMMEITPHIHSLASSFSPSSSDSSDPSDSPSSSSTTSSRSAQLDYILSISPPDRLDALAMDAPKLALIADIAEAFRQAVRSYDPDTEPMGVETMDVFVADPPYYAAPSREVWRDKHLGRWRELCDGGAAAAAAATKQEGKESGANEGEQLEGKEKKKEKGGEEEPRWHDCSGLHAKMLDEEHIGDFAKRLKGAMKARGV